MEREGRAMDQAAGPSVEICQAIERAAAGHAAALAALRREVAAMARASGGDGPGLTAIDAPPVPALAVAPSPTTIEPAPAAMDDPDADALPTSLPHGTPPVPATELASPSVRVLDWWDDRQPALRGLAAAVLVALVAWLAGLAGLAGLALVLAR